LSDEVAFAVALAVAFAFTFAFAVAVAVALAVALAVAVRSCTSTSIHLIVASQANPPNRPQLQATPVAIPAEGNKKSAALAALQYQPPTTNH